MSNDQVTYLVAIGCGLLGLIVFGALVLVPAMGAYTRRRERAVAAVLSVYVLVAFVMLGVLLGAGIIYYWPHLF